MKPFFQSSTTIRFSIFLSIVLCLFHAPQAFSQEDEVVKKEEVLSITEISNRIEESNRWIKSLEKELELDSDLDKLYKALPTKSDSLKNALGTYDELYFQDISFEALQSLNEEIEKYHETVGNYKNKVSTRLDLFQTNLNELDEKRQVWIEIEEKYRNDIAINALLKERLKPLMDKFSKAVKNYQGIQKQELSFFNDLNALSNIIVQKMDLMEEREAVLYDMVFQENLPLWKWSDIGRDSTSLGENLRKSLKERKILITRYGAYHYRLMIAHLVLVVVLVLFLIAVKKKATVIMEERKNEGLGFFLDKPISAAYVISYLFTGVIYDAFPKAILEIVLISMTIPVGYLMIDFVSKFQRKVLFVFLLLFITYLIIELFPLLNVFGRVVSLVFECMILAAVWIVRTNVKLLELPDTSEKIVKFVFGAFTIVSVMTIVMGIVGSVQLSHMLLTGTVFSISIGIVLLLWNHILKTFAVLFFELPFISGIQNVVMKREKVEKRVFQVIGIYLIFEFLVGVANQFNIKNEILETWNAVIGRSYEFGELQVSFQDFINFFLVLVITVFLARFLKYMFGREILTKVKMERGMPNAIATTIYYFVLVIGFFLAAASTGIQWSKVNLALGAIGVGIGFGLQNVIYNFISGLILIYERPIQVGDTIEFGDMMGPVTEIGIRSSKVLTYEGAEVIVPNGNLISNEVINWTYTDQLKRRELIIKTTYDAKPEEVIATIKGILTEFENIMSDPAPSVFFTGFGDGTLDFRVLFWTHLDVGLSTGSNAAMAVYNGLVAAGYEMPLTKSAVVIEQNRKLENS